jgi:hypothetical protein
VAIANVMNELAHTPAAGAVGCIQLLFGEAPQRFPQPLRQGGNLFNPLIRNGAGDFALKIVFPDRVSQIFHGVLLCIMDKVHDYVVTLCGFSTRGSEAQIKQKKQPYRLKNF